MHPILGCDHCPAQNRVLEVILMHSMGKLQLLMEGLHTLHSTSDHVRMPQSTLPLPQTHPLPQDKFPMYIQSHHFNQL